jgi:hypothetical protein
MVRRLLVMSGTNGPVVLFGGGDSRVTYTNDTFLYSSRSNEWTKVTGEERDGDHRDDHERNVAAVGITSGRQLTRQGPTPRRP